MIQPKYLIYFLPPFWHLRNRWWSVPRQRRHPWKRRKKEMITTRMPQCWRRHRRPLVRFVCIEICTNCWSRKFEWNFFFVYYPQASVLTSPPPPIVNPPPLSTADQDYGEDEIDSEEDYTETEDEDEDLVLDSRPASAAAPGRASTTAPGRNNRPNSPAISGGRGNVANNLLAEDDDEDIDSILSPNARVEPPGKWWSIKKMKWNDPN